MPEPNARELPESPLVNALAMQAQPAMPVLREHRPHHLVVVLAAPDERAPQNAFLNGADLAERAVAAAVQHHRSCLEPDDADGLERKVEHLCRAGHEEPGAPIGRSQRETPLRVREAGVQAAKLE